MKFLGLLIMVLLMWWTFTLNQTERKIPVETRSQIIRELQESMIDFLVENVDGIQGITFLQSYTTTLVPGKQIVAYFKYSYEAPTPTGQYTRETRDGEFELVSEDGGNSWQPKALTFRDLSLEFLEELRISPNEQ